MPAVDTFRVDASPDRIVNAAELRALQAPLKNRYRGDPATAVVTSHADADLVPNAIAVDVESGARKVRAGLHPATGGDGSLACSADLVLDALVACAGVTLQAVATAMGITIRSGRIHAEGTWDARGTLGVSREVPVGLTAIQLRFDLDSDASPEQLPRLLELTERYCVVAQTLRAGVAVSISSAE